MRGFMGEPAGRGNRPLRAREPSPVQVIEIAKRSLFRLRRSSNGNDLRLGRRRRNTRVPISCLFASSAVSRTGTTNGWPRASPTPDWREELDRDHEMRWLEVPSSRSCARRWRAEAAGVPDDPDGFVAWFEALKDNGPGQGDPLFPWIAEKATLEEMRWFLTQEAAGEAGFDDLVAMTQVKFPTQAKLELARNYWDEMGRGNAKGMHGPMLSRLIAALRLEPEIETTLPESLALANAMTAMATNRLYAWHSVGALGAIELTAPGRSACTARALRRLGVRTERAALFRSPLDARRQAQRRLEPRGLAPARRRGPEARASDCGRRADPPEMRRALLRNLSRPPLARENRAGGLGLRTAPRPLIPSEVEGCRHGLITHAPRLRSGRAERVRLGIEVG